MPRNSNGTYSLPEDQFVAGTIIESSVMNSDLSDIASALTSSLATTGVAFMTAPLRSQYDGSVISPNYVFASATGTGFIVSANNFIFIMASAAVGSISASAAEWDIQNSFFGLVTITGSAFIASIDGDVHVSGGINIDGGLVVGFTGTPIPYAIQVGVDDFGPWNPTGGESRYFVFESSGGTPSSYLLYDSTNEIQLVCDGSPIFNIAATSYIAFYVPWEFEQRSAATPPDAGIVFIYAATYDGASRLAYVDDAGLVTVIGKGQWEEITDTTLTTSAGSLSINLAVKYSKITVAGVDIAKPSGISSINVDVSDNGGTLISCASIIANLGTNVFTSSKLAALVYPSAATDNSEFRLEISRADKTGAKQASCFGETDNDVALYGTAQIANSSAINYLQISFGDGDNLQAGSRFVVMGLVA